MANVVNITAAGRKDLEKELEELKARRPELAEKIATARSYGDLSENEDYSAARGEQKVVEGRILEIEDILLHAKIIKSGKGKKSPWVQLSRLNLTARKTLIHSLVQSKLIRLKARLATNPQSV